MSNNQKGVELTQINYISKLFHAEFTPQILILV